MNIAQAKQQICRAMQAYFKKNEYGRFRIPPEAQRPVFLLGPPGIGKTAIMKQVADELGVCLISYSMTHHTRQSALGLPLIAAKQYDGKAYSISEYTMSEIIASVYDMMEETGLREGILFLDEVNCVSETLAPVMLQFLQYKTFGRHRLPEGWIVVAAGNPPEYNRSARDFDIVTWDRLKRVDVEPDYGAWKEYALKKGTHAAVLTYLDIRKDNFFRVEATVDGKEFVTPRGWSDLAAMITLYEEDGLPVDRELIGQYVQAPEIAEDFAIYYDLYNKYRSDYQVAAILAGAAPEEIRQRAAQAAFDERLSLLGLLLDSVCARLREVMEWEDVITSLHAILKEVKSGASMEDKLLQEQERMNRDLRRGSLSAEQEKRYCRVCAFLQTHSKATSDFDAVRTAFQREVTDMRAAAQAAGAELENLFAFAESVWQSGQELLILVTELTMHYYAARFIARYGCDAYYRHNQELMFYQRKTAIIRELEQLSSEL